MEHKLTPKILRQHLNWPQVKATLPKTCPLLRRLKPTSRPIPTPAFIKILLYMKMTDRQISGNNSFNQRSYQLYCNNFRSGRVITTIRNNSFDYCILGQNKDQLYDSVTSESHRIDSVIRLYLSATILRQQGHNVNHLNLVVPDSRIQVIQSNINDWDTTKFMELIDRAIQTELTRRNKYPLSQISLMNELIGRHVGYTVGCYSDSLVSQQLVSIGVDLLYNSNSRLNSNNKVYVHSEATNLARLSSDYTYRRLETLIKKSVAIGCSGIVVHTGTKGSLTKKEAHDNLRTNLKQLSRLATFRTKLLLETPAGQTNEILASMDEFITFWQSLSSEIQSRMGLVFDSCHVFAAGYDPCHYLSQLVQKQLPVKLIHFNDSKYKLGSRRDRHSPAGQGWIGAKTLIDLIELAKRYKIACVREY